MTDEELAKLKAAAEAYVKIQETANTIQCQRGNCLEYWDAEKQIDDYGDAFRSEAQAETISSLIAEVERLRAALTEIAAYGDTSADDHLKKTGSYSFFDEPGSVEIARDALEGKP